MLDEADELAQDLSRLQVYTFLRLSMDATDVEANDLTTIGRDRGGDIENDLIFLGLEWIALDDDPAECAARVVQELAPYAHKLRVEREEKPYVLSEPEEQALNARRPVVSSWQSLHDRQVSTLEVPFDSGDGVRPHTVSELLSCLYRNDREVRLKALDTLFEGLEPRADVLAACYDALVGDRLTVDRLRGFTNPMQPTNMNNELDDETVEAMITATEENYGIGRKWFEAKARLLGLDRLELADQYAPIGEARAFSWPEAVEVVDTSFGRFSPKLAEIFRELSRRRPRRRLAAQRQGAGCVLHGSVEADPPVRPDELHRAAARRQHARARVRSRDAQRARAREADMALTPLRHPDGGGAFDVRAVARRRLSARERGRRGTRASLAADRLENAFAAIYRQTVLARFEQRAYGVRGEGLALGVERLNELWIEENTRYYGDSLTMPEGYAYGWSYIPHFIHVRFYTYAYSFAQLVALLLYRRYREDPEAFAPKYLELLAKGGSASPADLVAPFGLDLRSTDTWREAFAELDAMRVEAETLSGA